MSKTLPKENKAPKVEPIHVKEFTVKQSKYEVCGKLPIRSVILGPSGFGKRNSAAAKHDNGYIQRLLQSHFYLQPEHRGRHDLETSEGLHRETHEGKA